jgi:hypothetical protein
MNTTNRARERCLIVRNLANGVALDEVRRAFNRTDADIAADIRFVGDKIASYCIARCRPLRDFGDVGVLRANRALVHLYLDRVDLDVLPRFKNIRVEAFDAKVFKERR